MRILPAVMAAAVSLSATIALAAEGVGEVKAVIATASISGQSGDRALTKGARVFVGDLVTTDAKGSAQLLFADGTRMVVGTNSSLMIDEARFSGNAAENRFAVNAMGGAFRFISGDGGDRGYSIRTPSARISVRGTAFDFFVIPGVETKLLLLEGEVELCSETDESGEGGKCAIAATPCTLLQTGAGEDVEEIEPGDRRDREISENFPLVMSDTSLEEAFQVAGHGCRPEGGTAQFVLDGSGIKTPHLGFGAGAIILCVILCPSGSSSIDTNNNTN